MSKICVCLLLKIVISANRIAQTVAMHTSHCRTHVTNWNVIAMKWTTCICYSGVMWVPCLRTIHSSNTLFFECVAFVAKKWNKKYYYLTIWSRSKCRKNWKNGTVRFQLTKWSNTWAKGPASAFRVERPFTWADRKLKIDIVHNIILCVSVCIHYYWVIHSVSVLRVLYDIWISHIQFTNPY